MNKNELCSDKAWLYSRYIKEELSCNQIAKSFNCGCATVHRWLVRFGIPRRKKRERDGLTHRERVALWRRNHPERVRELRLRETVRARQKRQQIKIDVLTYYGNGKCACVKCDESRLACLSIDHIGGGGNKHRKELFGTRSGNIYNWLIENGYPSGYQTLCMNCQFLKRYELREQGDGKKKGEKN